MKVLGDFDVPVAPVVVVVFVVRGLFGLLVAAGFEALTAVDVVDVGTEAGELFAAGVAAAEGTSLAVADVAGVEAVGDEDAARANHRMAPKSNAPPIDTSKIALRPEALGGEVAAGVVANPPRDSVFVGPVEISILGRTEFGADMPSVAALGIVRIDDGAGSERDAEMTSFGDLCRLSARTNSATPFVDAIGVLVARAARSIASANAAVVGKRSAGSRAIACITTSEISRGIAGIASCGEGCTA